MSRIQFRFEVFGKLGFHLLRIPLSSARVSAKKFVCSIFSTFVCYCDFMLRFCLDNRIRLFHFKNPVPRGNSYDSVQKEENFELIFLGRCAGRVEVYSLCFIIWALLGFVGFGLLGNLTV